MRTIWKWARRICVLCRSLYSRVGVFHSKEPRPAGRGFCKPRGNLSPLRYELPFLPALPSGASWQILVKSPRNIIRIDHARSRTYGWRVTLQRKGKIIARTFSDGVYGGKRKALNVAIDCRSVLLSQYSTLDHQLWVRTRLRRNNTSGIPGVGRYEVLANPNTGSRSAFWLASWVNEHGASRKRKFYVSYYGERQAKRLAVIERERQLHRVCTIKSTQS